MCTVCGFPILCERWKDKAGILLLFPETNLSAVVKYLNRSRKCHFPPDMINKLADFLKIKSKPLIITNVQTRFLRLLRSMVQKFSQLRSSQRNDHLIYALLFHLWKDGTCVQIKETFTLFLIKHPRTRTNLISTYLLNYGFWFSAQKLAFWESQFLILQSNILLLIPAERDFKCLILEVRSST